MAKSIKVFTGDRPIYAKSPPTHASSKEFGRFGILIKSLGPEYQSTVTLIDGASPHISVPALTNQNGGRCAGDHTARNFSCVSCRTPGNEGSAGFYRSFEYC